MLRNGSICLSFLYNYATGVGFTTNKSHDEQVNKLRCVSETFKNYGGILSKISQILSIDDTNNNVFSDCKPYSTAETTKKFKRIINENPEMFSDLKNIDFNVYKSGSIGQIHKASFNDKDIIIKIQYEGLEQQVQSDLKLLDLITKNFYSFIDMKDAMRDIKTKMVEELSYDIEFDNHKSIYDIWNNCNYIQIPELITQFSNEKMLAMYFIEGRSLNEFLDNSTQEQRNKVSEHLIRFIFENIFIHNILYSDIHYGNFLIKDDDTICVLDFGCVHFLSEILVENLKNLLISLKNGNREEFYSIINCMGIIKNTTSEKSINYAYSYFLSQVKPWITNDVFQFNSDYVEEAMDKEPELLKEWGLPGELLYFNKIPQGMYKILSKLKAKMNFSLILDDIFSKIKEEES